MASWLSQIDVTGNLYTPFLQLKKKKDQTVLVEVSRILFIQLATEENI